MKLELSYGKGSLPLTIPDGLTVKTLLPNEIKIGGEADLVKDALLHPIGTERLCKIVNKGEKIVIITSDVTRPVPSKILLPYLLEELALAGVEFQDITVVFALGSHRSHTEAEKIKLVGEEIYAKIECVDSDGQDFSSLGMTKRGTPVEIFTRVAQADRRICLGNIEYHYFAGYSGGAKAVMPGVSTQNAIQKNHSRMLEPGARTGNMIKNPVREDIEEAAAMVGIDFILNVVLDENKNIAGAFCGDATRAHRKGCEFLDSLYKVGIEKLYDIVIVSAGGYPKDINLYQAQKALDNASHGVKEGGVLILCAKCAEGLGGDVFKRWIYEAKTPAELVNRLAVRFELGGHKAAAIAGVLQKSKIVLVSDMEEDLVKKAFLKPFFSMDEAFKTALGHFKHKKPDILYMPIGGSTLPALI